MIQTRNRLVVCFFLHIHNMLYETVHDSAIKTVEKVVEFWNQARISIYHKQDGIKKVLYLLEYKSHFFVPKYRPKSQVRLKHKYIKCIVCNPKFFQGISLLSLSALSPFTQSR